MLLLVFFWSHVDDSHDKVLKLAPLKQLPSKVNFNLPTERPGAFVFNETPRYDSRGFVVRRHAYLCQQSLHVRLYQHACSGMFMRRCMHAVGRNIMCGLSEGLPIGSRSLLTKDPTWNRPEQQGLTVPTDPFPSALPGYAAAVCLTLLLLFHQLLNAPFCPVIGRIGYVYATCVQPCIPEDRLFVHSQFSTKVRLKGIFSLILTSLRRSLHVIRDNKMR